MERNEKLLAFCDAIHDKTGLLVTHEDGSKIIELAFGTIKGGLINLAINCNLPSDMNALQLDSVLNELDHEKYSDFKHFELANDIGKEFQDVANIKLKGKILAQPEHWELELWDGSYLIDAYTYDNEADYDKDIVLLKKLGFQFFGGLAPES